MSVNINVNGKFVKHTNYPILDDSERTRKELEHRRRTLRLQQVRAQSKELARKIRNDVSQEKEKQLRKLEEIKAQELNCWREHVLAQKCHDYQKSVVQIGQAHEAAKAEREAKKLAQANNQNNAKLTPRIRVLNKPQQTMPQRKAEKQTTNRFERLRKLHKRIERIPSPLKKTPIKKTPIKITKCLNVCFDDQSKHCSCTILSDSEHDEKSDTDLKSSSSLSSMSSLESLENTEVKCTQTEETKNAKVSKSTTTSQLNLQLKTEQPIIEADDMPAETSVLEINPKKATTSTQTSKVMTPEVSENSVVPITSTSSLECMESTVRPRYTQISDLIAKLNQAEMDKQVSTPRSPKRCTIIEEKSTSSATTAAKRVSPVKAPKSINSHLLMVPKSSAATILTQGLTERAVSGSDSSVKVQSYDYRNRYAKEFKMPTAKVVPENNHDMPNAMQQADLEKNLQKKREEELEKLRQKSDERGQRALEREQVRRDCIELTEKLEALTQQRQNVLPSDANLHNHQYFSMKSSRKEAKMNTAIEELLSRPAIITCPDVRTKRQIATSQQHIEDNNCKCPIHLCTDDLNLGSLHFRRNSDSNVLSKSSGSESCGSILLGYIDDQRDHIRNEITQCETNPESSQTKIQKLQKLMERIDQLRDSLLKEINKNNDENQKVDKTTQAHKASIDEANRKVNQVETATKEKQQLDVIEKNVTTEPLKKQANIPPTTSVTEIKIVTDKNQIIEPPQPGKPLEIVIKVRNEKRSSKRNPKPKLTQATTLIKQQTLKQVEHKKTAKTFMLGMPSERAKTTKETTATTTAAAPEKNRRNSYDSNSTAYRSIPPALTNAAEEFVNRMTQLQPIETHDEGVEEEEAEGEEEETNETEASSQAMLQPTSNASTELNVSEPVPRRPRRHLNPLIAQYIQRLLAMSRESVNALDISSSEIETPSSSIVNITANMPNMSGQSLLRSEDHIQRVERFINENRNFIHELEESFRTHSNSSLETSIRILEEAWKQKFKKAENKSRQTNEAIQNRNSALKLDHLDKNQRNEKANNKPTTTATTTKTTSKRLKTRQSELKTNKVPIQTNETKNKQVNATENTQKKADSELLVHTQTELKHYAELTKNCSTRIAELTALITKVREEKQRLLEVTLTSVSDNERHSTEYHQIPTTAKAVEPQLAAATTASGSSSSIDSQAEETTQHFSTQTAENVINPLEKHKKTGQSRDSGISMPSRPVTAMGGNEHETEPQSFVSSVQTTATYTTSSIQRKTRPPPAIATQNRYSPQLLADEEIVHELSTIVEVDTPATSRLNASLSAQTVITQDTKIPKKHVELPEEPLRFATFEEYVRENNLDLTTFDQDQSLRLEHEYNELIEAIKAGQGDKAFNYDAFPTLTTYLQNLTTNPAESSHHTPETFDELFKLLRLTSITAEPFPTHREYINQRETNSTEKEFIDTDSLENATTTVGGTSALTESESETINIEDELKRRNILKGSFRSLSTRQEAITLSSSPYVKKRAQSKISAHSTAFELAGIERLSTSGSDSVSEKFQQELMALGLQWPQTMRKREKQLAALSSSSTSEENNKVKRTPKSPKKHNKSVADYFSDTESSDRPLNLRDFLTRQLLKHAAATSSCESSLSGDSLRSQFFLSVLHSMTPSVSPRINTNTANHNALERQKTSTPVPSPAGESVSQSTQLFSNESRLSSVHPQEQGPKTSKNKKTDKSSKNGGK